MAMRADGGAAPPASRPPVPPQPPAPPSPAPAPAGDSFYHPPSSSPQPQQNYSGSNDNGGGGGGGGTGGTYNPPDERGPLIKRGFLVYAPTQVDGLKLGIVRATKGTKSGPDPLLQGFALGDEIDERRADKDLEDPGLFHFAVGTALTCNRASLTIGVIIAQQTLRC